MPLFTSSANELTKNEGLDVNKPKKFTLKDWIKTYLYGLCMGTSDIVPGISGGTIAFIMGFYQDLLSSINSLNIRAFFLLFSFRFSEFSKTVGWKFLLALILGISTAFITLASFFNYLLNHELYRCFLYSGFLGLILASTFFCAKQLSRWRLTHYACLGSGVVIAFFLTGSQIDFPTNDPLFDVKLPESYTYSNTQITNFDAETHFLKDVPQSTLSAMVAKKVIPENAPIYSHTSKLTGIVTDFTLPYSTPFINSWIICCGAIAVSALLLPGISGSYLLTILGMYSVVIAALVDFINSLKSWSFDGEAFSILANMLVGIICGALIFSRVVSWLLHRYHDCTIALLTGFMIGALRSVWPFWSYSYALLPLKLEKGVQLDLLHPILPSFTSPLFLISCVFVVVGFASVFVLEFIAQRISKISETTLTQENYTQENSKIGL